ncbi:MAG: cyclodeaminase [Gammaproteobacteria bacterium]|nr:cyclodeaminase [Gammaproteobacteria bacterium]
MPTVNLLSEADLRRCVQLDSDAIECIEDCFRILATQDVIMPPIMRMDIVEHHGEVDVKTAYLPGLDNFAIKMSPGFFDNPKIGLSSTGGMMVLFNSKTGVLDAVLLDNGYLTVVRTAAAGAVAAKHLSRTNSRHIGIIGAGDQARQQLHALTLVRDIQSAKIWARDADKAREFAQKASTDFGIEVTPVETPSMVCEKTDIIVTTTPSHVPILSLKDLHLGQHVTAMGSDAEDKNELAPDIVAGTSYFCDRLTQVAALGELHHALLANKVDKDRYFPELGQVIAGLATGRQSEDEITVCDLTGTGAQDTAIATLANQRAISQSMGVSFKN